MEQLRALFFDTFKLKERQPQGVTVYYFSEKDVFKAYSAIIQRQSLAGYYLYRPDRSVIAISPSWSDEAERYIVFHEYIHHLNRLLGAEPPLWYNEGVAELFSTIETEKGRVLLGKHLPWHVSTLREKKLLPLETLFSVDKTSTIYNTGKHSGLFYAESWVLLHFWRFGNVKRLDKEKFGLFLRYLLNEAPGTDPALRRVVFKDLMGMDYPELERLLGEYIQGGKFSLHQAPMPQIPAMETYTKRAVPPEEITERLAELSLRVTQSPEARLLMLQKAEKNPADFRVWEILGADSWSQNEPGVAEERWLRAIEAGSNNPAVFHEVGQIESRKWFTKFDYDFRFPEPRAQQLRSLLKRSIECAPNQYAGYEMLAWVEASVVKPEIANVNLVQQNFKVLHNRANVVLALALVRIRLGDYKSAKELLEQFDKMNPAPTDVSTAEIIRKRLKAFDPVETAPPEPDSGPVQPAETDLPEQDKGSALAQPG